MNELEIISCPKCKSINVEVLDVSDRKRFSVNKGLIGTMILDTLGAIAGFAGKKGRVRLHCLNCRKVFNFKF